MDFTKGGRNPLFWAWIRIAKHEFEAENEQEAASALQEAIKYVDFSSNSNEMDTSAESIIRFSRLAVNNVLQSCKTQLKRFGYNSRSQLLIIHDKLREIIQKLLFDSTPLITTILNDDFSIERLKILVNEDPAFWSQSFILNQAKFHKHAKLLDNRHYTIRTIHGDIQDIFPDTSKYFRHKITALIAVECGFLPSKEDYSSKMKTPYNEYLVKTVQESVRTF